MMAQQDFRTQKQVVPRLIIEAICLLWKDHGGDLSQVKNLSGRRTYQEFSSEWDDVNSVFKVETRYSGNFGKLLKTYPRYSKRFPESGKHKDECYWLYAKSPEYGPAILYLGELGLADILDDQETNLKGSNPGGGGQLKKIVKFNLGPFPSSDLQECLEHYELTLREGWNPLAPQKLPSELPTGLLHNLPPFNTAFVGEKRARDLERIHERLEDPNRIKHISVTGLGGLGKTMLAAQYAIQYIDHYPGGCCFIEPSPASEREMTDDKEEQAKIKQVKADRALQIVSFALALGIDINTTRSVSEQMLEVWRKLPDRKTLFIVDDVKATSELNKLIQHDKKNFIFLSTSRVQWLGTFIECINLELPELPDAITQLKNFIDHDRVDRDLDVVEEMLGDNVIGRLPLAVTLLGSFLAVDERSKVKPMADTLIRLKSAREKQALMDDDTTQDGTNITDSHRGLKAIFDLTWNRLDPAAQQAGKLLAFFSHTFIDWVAVDGALESLFSQEICTNLDEVARNTARSQLALHSLIFREFLDEEPDGYRYHSLIGDFFWNKRTPEDTSTWLSEAEFQAGKFTIIEAPNIDESSHRVEFDRYKRRFSVIEKIRDRSLMRLLTSLPGSRNDMDGSLSYFYLRTGNSEKALSIAKAASTYANMNISVPKKLRPEGQKDTVTYLPNPNLEDALRQEGHVHEETDNYKEAEESYEKALDAHKKYVGDEHPSIANTLVDKANVCVRQERYNEAETLYKQALEICKKHFGYEHESVASCLQNLFLVYLHQGRRNEAMEVQEESLELKRKLSGSESVAVADSLINSSSLDCDMGRYEKANKNSLRALEIYKRLLGKDHPKVETSLYNVGNIYCRQGQYDEAEPFLVEALARLYPLSGIAK